MRFSRRWLWRMPSSGLLRHVAIAKTNVPPKHRFLQEPNRVTSQKTAFFRKCCLETYNILPLDSTCQFRRIEFLKRMLSSWIFAHLVLLCSLRRLLVTANIVPSSPILVTVMMEAIRSSETSVLTRVTRRNIAEDGILMKVPFTKILRLFIVESITQCKFWIGYNAFRTLAE
jgi:hypothetical protein